MQGQKPREKTLKWIDTTNEVVDSKNDANKQDTTQTGVTAGGPTATTPKK